MSEKRRLGVFWSRLQKVGAPTDAAAEGAEAAGEVDLQPGEVAFGYQDGRWMVRIRPDGTCLFGEGYAPDEAAKLFWAALAAQHPNVSLREQGADDVAHARAMEAVLLDVGRRDLHNEAMQLAAAREGATEYDRFQAQLALSNLEVAVHRAIEYGRGIAVRTRGRD